jgi:outer membrane protein TolC
MNARVLILAGAVTLIAACSTPLALPPDYREHAYDRAGSPSPLDVRAPARERAVEPLLDLGLVEARRIALANNPTVEAAGAAVEAARARITEARAPFLPTVAAGIQRTFNRFSSEATIPGMGTITFSPKEQTTGQLTLSQSLFSFGRDWEAVQAARAALSTEVLAERGAHQVLLFDTSQAWYAVHEAESYVVVAQDALAAALRQLEDARNIVSAGMATKDAELTARVNWLNSQQAVLAAGNEVIHARRVLNTLLDRPLDAEITLAAPPEYSPAALDTTVLRRWALAYNPSLLAFRTQRMTLEHTRESVLRSFAPDLVGSVTGTYTDFTGLSGHATNWMMTLGLQWQPVNGGRRIGQLSELHANLAELRAREIEAIQRTELAITRAVLDLRTQDSAVEVARESIVSAEENYRIISDRFRAGKTTSQDVLDAQWTLSNSRNVLNQALFAHWVLLASLETLVGVPLEDIVAPPAERSIVPAGSEEG